MIWPLVLAGLAAAALLAPLPAPFVERLYSSSVYPLLQRTLTSASNLTPVAWLDLLTVLVVASLVLASLRDAGRWPASRVMLRLAARLVSVAALACLAFVLAWGLNYRRTLPAVGLTPSTVPARPKRSLLDLYFRRAGVAGMTDPFFLETLMASDILPFERPHVVAHEWAHLAGITDEGEANFVGWLTCVRGTPSQQYSGWLFLYSEVLAGLPRDRAQPISALLSAGPRADLQALRERSLRELSPRVSGAGWLVYDQYLKANRVEAGTASYAQVVQLVLGTELR